MVEFVGYPPNVRRGALYWLKPGNIWAARQKIFRRDNSIAWRRAMEARYPSYSPDRSVPFSRLVGTAGALPSKFRFLILGDTGEGDYSQFGTLPMIRAMLPSFLIINGDVAYPAGRNEDFASGFFGAYAGLNIPIWATPGNHEYYSTLKGSEFFEIFCTHTRNREWMMAGLRHVPQPGTYFEIKEDGCPLVVLGLDTGQAGDMDGVRSGTRDDWQHNWLKWRLSLAQSEKKSVIVMFHIPALVNGEHQNKDINLGELHRLLVQYDCVRLIVCGHIHNFQSYTPDTFRAFIKKVYKVTPVGNPQYVVCGGGGAYLESTDFAKTTYPLTTFPTAKDYKGYVTAARNTLDKMGILSSAIGRAGLKVAAALDPDDPKYLSFISVEVEANSVKAIAVEIPDARKEPYEGVPKDTSVNVMSPHTLITPQNLTSILDKGPQVQLWP